MRQRLRKYIPVFLIALMVQILAPIGASVAIALAASDPLAAAEICQDHVSVPAPGDQGSQHQAHEANCVMCCVFGASAAPANAPDTVGVAVPYRIDQGVVWQVRIPQLADSFTGSNARARAPPSLS